MCPTLAMLHVAFLIFQLVPNVKTASSTDSGQNRSMFSKVSDEVRYMPLNLYCMEKSPEILT